MVGDSIDLPAIDITPELLGVPVEIPEIRLDILPIGHDSMLARDSTVVRDAPGAYR